MEAFGRPIALVLAAGALMSINPAPQSQYSPELLALLDPTTRVASLCGGKDGGGSMRSNLMMAAAAVPAAEMPAPPLYDGMGKVHFHVTTSNPLAQRYFDQGLAFSYGFNHAAAIASFRQAQRLDPNCAMCWWGEALAHGPNINAPMDPAANARTIYAAQRAQTLAGRGTAPEKALISAMLRRYSPKADADRAALDAAYADAMLAVASQYPASDDIALLAAEAAMDTRPWDYWTPDKKPQPRLGEAIGLVQTVYARNPDHPQAAHLYIHLMENGPDPKLAEAAADRLATPLAPTPGHLVHMPAHIYYRLGRWKDSMRVNVEAARADEAWLKASGDRGLVRYGYYPHNVHFIVTSAQMAGDMPTAMREAHRLNGILDTNTSAKIAWIQAIHAAPFFAAAQFASPAAILSMAPADARLPYAVGMRHYARAVAFALQRNRAGFDREIRQMERLRRGGDFKSMLDQGVPAPDLLLLAETVARARWAYATRRYGEAARLYRAAGAIDEKIPYMEPPYWYYPVQQSLGAALYRQGKYDDAREAFTAALARAPNNGWALFGLAASERALGRNAQAAAANAALERAWAGDRRWLRMDRL